MVNGNSSPSEQVFLCCKEFENESCVSANIWLSVVCALTQPGGVLNPAPMPTPATNFARPVDSKVRRWSNGKLIRGVPDP